jgi:LmbE family N-acetylglucosaminyl deacetylase
LIWSKVKARLSAGTERAWSECASFAARLELTRVRATTLSPSTPTRRVFVLAPHPDDEACIAATLLAHAACKDQVSIAIVTDGRESKKLALAPEAMAARRRTEAEAARDLLHPHRWEWFGLHDLAFDEETLSQRLTPLLAELDPEIIYTPCCVDMHPDHLRTARALALSLKPTTRARIRCYQVQIPLTPALVNLAIDGSTHRDAAIRVFEAHASQRESWQRTLRMKRYAARFYGGKGASWVDEYWELDAPAFQEIHLSHPPQPRFAGLRPHAFRDPIAYFAGIRERIELSARGKA